MSKIDDSSNDDEKDSESQPISIVKMLKLQYENINMKNFFKSESQISKRFSKNTKNTGEFKKQLTGKRKEEICCPD